MAHMGNLMAGLENRQFEPGALVKLFSRPHTDQKNPKGSGLEGKSP